MEKTACCDYRADIFVGMDDEQRAVMRVVLIICKVRAQGVERDG